ncbi:MAG: peptidase S9, partial [Mucilaginibacter sp.]
MNKFLPVLFILITSAAFAQKKPLDHQVFDGWQNVSGQRISNNGKWIAYVVKPQEGDAALYITTTNGKSKISIPRADTVRFTADSKYAVCMIRPFYKDLRQAKIKKKK